MEKNIKAHLLVILATFLVAGSFLASAKLSGIIDPISLTLLRFILASLFLAPIIFFKKDYRLKLKMVFKKAMIISLFYSLYFIGLFKALESTTALNTGTLFTLTPLITGFFAIFILKQKMNINQFIIYLIGIIGTCIVVFKADLQLFLNFSLNSGDIIFLFAIISMSLYSISTKYLYKEGDKIIVLTFMTLIGGCIWMGLALGIMGVELQWQEIKGELLIYMLYLVIGATLITVYLYQQAAIDLGPKKLMAYVYLNPAAVAILLYILEGLSISFGVIFGIIISSMATIILLLKD